MSFIWILPIVLDSGPWLIFFPSILKVGTKNRYNPQFFFFFFRDVLDIESEVGWSPSRLSSDKTEFVIDPYISYESGL